MTHYLFILVGAVLVNNVVLVKILGLCPFMGVSKKLDTAFGMGAATTFVLTVATGASYVIDHFLLTPFGRELVRHYREFAAELDALASRRWGRIAVRHGSPPRPARGKGTARGPTLSTGVTAVARRGRGRKPAAKQP